MASQIEVGARQIDVGALYGALDSRRNMREISWRELARELGISSSVFTRLAQGRQPDLETYLLMTGWLEVSADAFRGGGHRSEAESEDTVEKIASYLHADKALKPESAQAITRIVQAAYQEMAGER